MYCVIDIETTGLSKHTNHITEIAAVVFDGTQIVQEWESLINPGVRIPRHITRITGIDDEMVRYSPTIQEVLPEFIEFLSDHTFVAHNISFDHGFIDTNLQRWYGYSMSNPKLCTRKLANRITHHLPSKSLGNLCSHYGIINTQAHRAMADVHATTQVLKQFLNHTSSLAHTSHLSLMDIQNKAVPWCRRAFV